MRYPGRRTFCRVASTATCGVLLANTLLISYACYGKDTFFLQHWNYGKPVIMKKTHLLAFWENALSAGERGCVQAWLDAMSLKSPSHSLFSPLFVLQDTLLFVCGLPEWRSAVLTLSKLLGTDVVPYCMEIRRERQGDVIFLHLKLETELRPRFLQWAKGEKGGTLSFPSVATLQLEENSPGSVGSNKWRIAAAEHRWFGGPIVSQQSATLRSPWGDVGDILRRFFAYSMLGISRILVREKEL
ncbi:32 kDa ER-associated protein [Trypanosoma equiperdum]|nr:32 kDa ER-associated protein [Trypanosoma equiperdum]